MREDLRKLGFCHFGVSDRMNTHALNVIEFPRTLALIAERATSPLGAERVRELRPVTDRDAIEREHSRVAAVRSLISAEDPWSLHGVPDARAALTRLRVEGASLAALDLVVLGRLLQSSRATRESLRGERASAIAIAVRICGPGPASAVRAGLRPWRAGGCRRAASDARRASPHDGIRTR